MAYGTSGMHHNNNERMAWRHFILRCATDRASYMCMYVFTYSGIIWMVLVHHTIPPKHKAKRQPHLPPPNHTKPPTLDLNYQ